MKRDWKMTAQIAKGRWAIIAVAFVGVIAGCQTFRVLPQTQLVPLLALLSSYSLLNLLYRRIADWLYSSELNLIFHQFILDAVVITIGLHFSGGIENPFYLSLLLPIIVGGVLLKFRQAIMLALAVSGLFIEVALTEHYEVFHHVSISLFPHPVGEDLHAAHDLAFVLGKILVFVLTTWIATYFLLVIKKWYSSSRFQHVPRLRFVAAEGLIADVPNVISETLSSVSLKLSSLLQSAAVTDVIKDDLRGIAVQLDRIPALTHLSSFNQDLVLDEEWESHVLNYYQSQPLLIRFYNRIRWSCCPFSEIEKLVPVQGNILDLGCGFGLFTFHLATQSSTRKLLGVDVSENRVHVANEICSDFAVTNTRFRKISPGEVPIHYDGWDAIIIVDVLYLASQDAVYRTLDAAYGKLKKDGYLIVKEMSTLPRWKARWNRIQENLAVNILKMTLGQQLQFVTTEQIKSWMQGRNMEIQELRLSDGYPYPHLLLVAKKVLAG